MLEVAHIRNLSTEEFEFSIPVLRSAVFNITTALHLVVIHNRNSVTVYVQVMALAPTKPSYITSYKYEIPVHYEKSNLTGSDKCT